jgi:midasin, putative
MNISVKGDASQVQNYLRLYVTMSDVSEYSSLDQMRKQLMNEFMKTDNEQSFDLFSNSVSERVDNTVEESDDGFVSDFEDLAEVDDFDVDDVRDPEEAWEKTLRKKLVADVENVADGKSNIDEAEFYYDSDGFLAVKGTDLEQEEVSVEDNSELEGKDDFEDVVEDEVVDDEGDFDDWGSWDDESEDEEFEEEYVEGVNEEPIEEVTEEPVENAEEVVEEAVETSSRFPTDKSAMGGLGYVRDTYKLDEVQSLPPMREFVKKNPQISKLEVIELYGSKEVQKQLKLGKVYERKGRLFI